MACTIVSVPGALFTLWGTPPVEDLQCVSAEMQAAVERAGRPILYVARVPPRAPAPDAAARKYLNGMLAQFVASCSSFHAVVEGSGFGAAFKRGVLLSAFQLNWAQHKFYVHANMEQVLDVLDGRARPVAAAIIASAGGKGLLQQELA